MSHYSCPICSGSTSVIETRLSYQRLRRRRSCSQGHRFTTLEMPHDTPKRVNELLSWLSKQGLDSEIADYARSQLTSIFTGKEEEDSEETTGSATDGSTGSHQASEAA